MRDVGDEIAPRLFHTLDLGLIMQHSNCAAAGHGSRGHVEDAAGKNLRGTRHGHIARGQRVLHRRQNFRIAHRLHQRRAQPDAAGHQPLHSLIGPQHAPVLRHRDDCFLHRVQQRLQRLPAVLQIARNPSSSLRAVLSSADATWAISSPTPS